ncbi:MAG: 3-hydroxyacyl-ACP dehydratase FabZ [Rhodobacteraceae bacterium]|nr:3-hydroxyacyl-ACP dehydratase FabZ [Paracoccaceae bacterium]
MNDAALPEPATTEADFALIQRIIPHRFPFLLVDRVRAIVPGASAVGIKNVTANEPHFQGHFPGLPIMPGVTIIEAMAQTAGVLVGITLGLENKGALVYFMSIERGKFRRKVVPGDVLELHVRVLRGGARVWRFEGRGMVGPDLAAEAEFTAMIDFRRD